MQALILPTTQQIIINGTLALLTVFLILRILDKLNDISFKNDVWPEIRKGNRAAGQYFGSRFLGACLLVGAIVLSGL